MAAAQRAAATNGPGPDLGPGPDPGSGSGPDPPRETMMGVSFLPTIKSNCFSVLDAFFPQKIDFLIRKMVGTMRFVSKF